MWTDRLTNVADVITAHARATPSAVALVEGARSWSYLDLDRAIWRAAHALRAQGFAPGMRVGVMLPNDALHLVTAYALARIGAVQLSIAEEEPAAGREAARASYRLAVVLAAADVQPAWLDAADDAIDERVRAPGGDAPWKMVTTSGTTSAPKNVLQTHAMHIAWRRIHHEAIPVAPRERFLATIPLSFTIGFRLCTELHWAGASVVISGSPRTVDDFASLMERHAADYLYLMPLQIHSVLTERLRLPTLKRLRSGSMTVHESLRQAILRSLTPNLVITYGTNEAGSPLALATGDTLARHPGSVGLPPRGVELRITDDAGRMLPAGETGLVAVRAAGMPAAYEDNPEASVRTFRGDWYYPGDLGALSPEGALHLKGRADDLMNFDGLKIYPAEVEAVLLDHPAIAEAAVFAMPSKEHGQIPVAVVVVRSTVERRVLLAYCRSRLGKRAPHALAILEALPKNPAGKVLKRELPALARAALERGR
jgi:acyl-coenzyme A synthetase/AMP-(fatty) acid ligase